MAQTTDAVITQRLKEAEALMTAGNHEDALMPLNKAIFLAPDDPELYIVRGDAYLGVYDIASAIQNYRRADKLLLAGDVRIPGSALSNTGLRLSELHAMYARRLLVAERFEPAETQARNALVLRPQHRPYRIVLILSLAGGEKYDECFSEIQSLLDLDSRQPDLYILRCRINIRRKSLEQVVDDMTSLMQLAPAHPEVQALSAGMQSWTEDLIAKAMGHIMESKYDDAMALLDRALNLRPGDADLLYRRGICHRLSGRHEDAMKDMEDAVDAAGGIYPEASRQLRILHNEMGVQYYSWNLYPEAIEQFDLAIRGEEGSTEMDEAMAMIYANRGDCYQILGSDDKALADYEVCIQELNKIRRLDDPEGNPVTIDEEKYTKIARKCAASFYNRGRLAVTFGEFSRAASFFTRAIEMGPDVAEYRFQRALILSRLDLHKQQKEDLEKVIQLEPGHERAMKLLMKVSPHHEAVLQAGVQGLSVGK